MPLFLVEALHQHRVRYLVDTECAVYAEDTVVCEDEDMVEFDQKFLGSTIVSTRELTHAEAQQLHSSPEVAETGSPWLDLGRLIYKPRV